MAGWLLQKTRLLRRPLQPLSVMALAILFMLFPCLLTRQADAKRNACEKALDSIPVGIVLSDFGGSRTEDLRIPRRGGELFFSEDYYFDGVKQPRSIASFVKNVRAKASIFWSTESEGSFSGDKKLVGMNDLLAEPAFEQTGGRHIDWLENEDADFFRNLRYACVIPRDIFDSMEADEDGRFRIRLKLRAAPSSGQTERELSLEIAGAHDISSADIYCPLELVRELCREMNAPLQFDSLRAEAAENRELDTLRGLLSRHFTEVDPFADPYELMRKGFYAAVVIHDELLQEAVGTLRQDIRTLKIIRPFMMGAECAALALAVFFLFHVRRKDLAKARALGSDPAPLMISGALEVFILLAMAFAVKAAAFGAGAENGAAALLFLFAEGGMILAVLSAVGKRGFALLKEKE